MSAVVYSPDDEPNYDQLGHVQAVAAALNVPVRWEDEAGYRHDIWAAAVEAGTGRLAWVEHIEKVVERNGRPWFDVCYRLRGRDGGRGLFDREVPTYNPAFGCTVGYMAWHDGRVVLVYEEKHHTYAWSVGANGAGLRERVNYEWRLRDAVLYYKPYGSQVWHRLSLPEFQPLGTMTEEEIARLGLE